jgi:hypothetical protein
VEGVCEGRELCCAVDPDRAVSQGVITATVTTTTSTINIIIHDCCCYYTLRSGCPRSYSERRG